MAELDYGSKRRKSKAGVTVSETTKMPKMVAALTWAGGTIGFVLISSVVGLMLKMNSDMATLQEQVSRVDQVEELIERETRLETQMVYFEEKLGELESQQNAPPAYLQLSSAKTQRGIGPNKVQMELKDAGENITFDPRRSMTDITIEIPGAYFIIAAPQINQPSNHIKTGSFDMWLRVNDYDVNNSNIRYSFPIALDATDVVVGQGVACYEKGDVITLIFSGTIEDVGLVAIVPEGEPLIPSVIFSMFRVGDC